MDRHRRHVNEQTRSVTTIMVPFWNVIGMLSPIIWSDLVLFYLSVEQNFPVLRSASPLDLGISGQIRITQNFTTGPKRSYVCTWQPRLRWLVTFFVLSAVYKYSYLLTKSHSHQSPRAAAYFWAFIRSSAILLFLLQTDSPEVACELDERSAAWRLSPYCIAVGGGP